MVPCFLAALTWFRFPGRLPAIQPAGSNPPSYRGSNERSGDGDGIPDAPPSRRDWKGMGGMPCLEDHASGCKWLGSPLFISHEKAICKGLLPYLWGLTFNNHGY